jgi:CheY-like chemotaxis protein
MTVSQSVQEFTALVIPHSEALAVDCAALVSNPADSEAIDRGFLTAQKLTDAITDALAVHESAPPAIALLAHELRNPLNAIVGIFHLLRIKPDQMFAKTALDSTLHLRRVLDDQCAADIVPLATLCRLAADSYLGLSEAKGVKLKLEVADDLPTCHLHAVNVRQILMNLLGNAMKFTPADGYVFLTAARDGSTISIKVRDTGVGMSEELLSRLFQAYVQAPETASLGSGLGLSITYGLIQELGGRIDVSSELGVGTEFCVELPLSAVQHILTAPVVNERHLQVSLAPAVLLVDDDEMIREVFGWGMEDAGIVCVGVGTCAEALEQAQKRHFDLILVDGLYGAAKALVPELRAIVNSKGHKTAIIGFSGYDSIGEGLDGVLPKPAQISQVLALLERFGADTSMLDLAA